jgi:CPA1 family monovalent cation:H+ antiporter
MDAKIWYCFMELGIEIQALWLLIVAAAVAMFAKQIRLPYTIALVVVGILMGILNLLPQMLLTPALVFHLFLPILLFEAAFNIDILDLRDQVKPIAILALPGVLLATAVTASITYAGLHVWGEVPGFSWIHALIFGAVVAATDPISVLALFKELGVTRRLSLIVEGESIFNDGVAVVLFGVLLEVSKGGGLDLLSAVRQFFVVAVGGGAIGVLLGLVMAKVMSLVDDHLIEITLTTVLAFSAYLLAEHLQVSGVMAVIAAGLLTGNYGTRTAMSPSTRVSVSDFWEYAAFAVNSVLFLMIGIEVRLVDFGPLWVVVLVAIVAMLSGRAAAVLLSAPVIRLVDQPLPGRWQGVLIWGGIRGAICMVLALSLPLDMPGRPVLMTMIFAVVIFTLLAQGLSIKTLLKRFGLIGLVQREAYETRKGEVYALGRAREELELLASRGVLSRRNHELLAKGLEERLQQLHVDLDKAATDQEDAVAEELRRAEERLLHAEKDGIREAFLAGIVSEKIMRKLFGRVDERLFDLAQSTVRSAADSGHHGEEKG